MLEMVASGRTGYYFAVIREGEVAAGDGHLQRAAGVDVRVHDGDRRRCLCLDAQQAALGERTADRIDDDRARGARYLVPVAAVSTGRSL